MLDTLGAGGFAKVNKAKYKGVEDYKFAIKSMRKKFDGINFRQAILNELDILNQLDHPNIANFNECYEDETFIHAVLEFSPGQSLAQYYQNLTEPLPTKDLLNIFYQVFNTASYLRKQEIIHRDYKPPNIMIYKTQEDSLLGYQIQLLDFGLARRKKVVQKELFGSPHYLSPECFRFETSFPSDIWSIGVMMYYCFSLQFPFDGFDDAELYKSIKEDDLMFRPFQIWENVDENIKDLIKKMLEKDPEKRITTGEIIKHPAFDEIHKLEKKLKLSKSEKAKLSKYFSLSPIQRKFLKYSTKFIPPKVKPPYCEKFMLLDIEWDGYIEFTTTQETSLDDSATENSVALRSDEVIDRSKTYKLTYSDFLAALVDKDLLWGELNIELLFHTLNPTYNNDKILKSEMELQLYFHDNLKEKAGFDKIEGIERENRVLIKKQWVQDFFAKIKKRLK